MMTIAEIREETATVERDRATHCPECDREFRGRVRKARGIADHERPGYQPCVECAEELFGDTNQAGEPFADDDTLAERAERAEQAQLEAYHGGFGALSINDQCDRDRTLSKAVHS